MSQTEIISSEADIRSSQQNVTSSESKKARPLMAPLMLSPLVLLVLLFTRRLGDTSLGYPDADRILMDGVFLHDFLTAFPISNPLEYCLTYYVQYPALSIGYRPLYSRLSRLCSTSSSG